MVPTANSLVVWCKKARFDQMVPYCHYVYQHIDTIIYETRYQVQKVPFHIRTQIHTAHNAHTVHTTNTVHTVLTEQTVHIVNTVHSAHSTHSVNTIRTHVGTVATESHSYRMRIQDVPS